MSGEDVRSRPFHAGHEAVPSRPEIVERRRAAGKNKVVSGSLEIAPARKARSGSGLRVPVPWRNEKAAPGGYIEQRALAQACERLVGSLRRQEQRFPGAAPFD